MIVSGFTSISLFNYSLADLIENTKLRFFVWSANGSQARYLLQLRQSEPFSGRSEHCVKMTVVQPESITRLGLENHRERLPEHLEKYRTTCLTVSSVGFNGKGADDFT